MVSFGTLTGPDAKLNLQSLYTKQIKLIGSTGGQVWKKFKLDNVKEAIHALSTKERDGRILLDIT